MSVAMLRTGEVSVGRRANVEQALVVSPRALVRSAVAGVLSSLDVVPVECEDAWSAERRLRAITPDLVLADLEFEWDAVCAGGFAQWCVGLPGRARLIALAASIRPVPRVPAGCDVLAPDAPTTALARLVAQAIARPAAPSVPPQLTERQRAALEMAARGATNHEIGHAMLITTGTVKRHLHDAFTALGARSRAEAVAVARSHGLL